MTGLPRSRKGPAEVEAHDGHPVEHGDAEVVDGVAEQLAGQRQDLDQKLAAPLAPSVAAGRVLQSVGNRIAAKSFRVGLQKKWSENKCKLSFRDSYILLYR